MLEKIKETTDFIKSKTTIAPEIGIILGSGLGNLGENIESPQYISYGEIPNFPVSTVKGHKGRLIFGRFGGKNVVALQGRFHFYEGYDMKQVTFPVRIFKELGIKLLIVSNAAGGMTPGFKIGDIMIINDHINMFPTNPLIGHNEDSLGPRFPDMSEPYDHALIEKMNQIAKSNNIQVHNGVYVGVSGPCFEGILYPGGHSENRAMPHWCWVSDYCPFGFEKPATSWVADSMGYRYGLNKQNAGTGYKTLEDNGQHFLAGQKLQTKIWNPNLDLGLEQKGGYENYQPEVNSLNELINYSLKGYVSEVRLGTRVINLLSNDANFLQWEDKLIKDIQSKKNGGSAKELIIFGGNTSTNLSIGWQGAITVFEACMGNHPFVSESLFPETWAVGRNELTWIVRKTYVDVIYNVNEIGVITMHYSINDILDLEPDYKNQEDMYNYIVEGLGYYYHERLGGRRDMKVKANWSKTIK
jgi:purine-nucleoside phosphorylase